jgi:peptidoglycan/LPS O-acetylase OafA/YrhL
VTATPRTLPPDTAAASPPASGAARPGKRLGFLPALEGIRGVALFIVLTDHIGLFIVPRYSPWLVPGGFVAMDIFFTLSGFLITALLLGELSRTGTIDFGKFFKRRAVRLLPALLLVLGAHYLLTLYLGTSLHVENRSDLFALTFTANYQHSLGITPPWDLNIIWSLAVEVQFYLVWPFVLWAIYRWGRTVRRMAFAMVALIVAASITRAVEFQRWGWEAVYYRFEGRIDAFVIGGMLSLFWFHDRLPRRVIPWLALVGWVVLITVLWTGRFPQHYLYQWGYLGLNLAGGAVIAACLFNDGIWARILSARFLRLAGRVSYSFYLVHMQVYFWVITRRPWWPIWQQIVVALTGAVVLGSICYLVAERPLLGRPPMRKWRKSTPADADPPRSPAPTPAPTPS